MHYHRRPFFKSISIAIGSSIVISIFCAKQSSVELAIKIPKQCTLIPTQRCTQRSAKFCSIIGTLFQSKRCTKCRANCRSFISALFEPVAVTD